MIAVAAVAVVTPATRHCTSRGSAAVIHPPTCRRGGNGGTSRTCGVLRAHGRTHVSAVSTAVPEAIDRKSEGFGPITVAGEKVALLWEVLVDVVRRRIGRAVLLLSGGDDGVDGVTIQHTNTMLLLLLSRMM